MTTSSFVPYTPAAAFWQTLFADTTSRLPPILMPSSEEVFLLTARQTAARRLQIRHQPPDIFRAPRRLGEKGVDGGHFITDIIGRLFPHLFDSPVDPFFPLGGETNPI